MLMKNVNFFTAVEYGKNDKSVSDDLLEKVDDYFFLCGKKAYVIDKNEKTVESKANFSDLLNIVKVISYFTVIIPAIMLVAKAILRSQHQFKVINVKEELEQGINISNSTIQKIQKVIKHIEKGKEDNSIEWLSNYNNYVFKLKDQPNLVFKLTKQNSKEAAEKRFANMIKAKEVCLAYQLGLMVIPHAKKIEVGNSALIVEEALNFNPDASAQEENYQKYSKDLNETARQLAIFIAKTGFNDVTWRNIPLIEEEGRKKVALIDIESMESAENGFIGDMNRSRGLIRCVSRDQLDIVINEAKKANIDTQGFEKSINLRLQELETDEKLRQYHLRNNIKGKESIQPNIRSLDLDLEAEDNYITMFDTPETITMKEVLDKIIFKMNKLIQKQSPQASLKGKRSITIDLNDYPFSSLKYLGIPDEIKRSVSPLTKEEEKQLWFHQIFKSS